ncbi:MAG: hypothetical protein FD143_200 [Ignavibacteria bacterium]|nr:MAG: hypothetical protein FD143_200 [Ignavibacteria bacterium]KAF0162111.1 MAG: hypothetical protein FD188_360 [Ignavibacteria bacterium]
MKKGCFLTTITIVTILVMIGIYVYKTESELIKNFGKDKLIAIASKEISEQIKNLEYTPYKDSLLFVLSERAKQIKGQDFDSTLKKFGVIVENVKLVINDGVLDSTEFAEIKKLVKSHERSEKNRN